MSAYGSLALQRAVTVIWSKILRKSEGQKKHPMDMIKWTYHDKHL